MFVEVGEAFGPDSVTHRMPEPTTAPPLSASPTRSPRGFVGRPPTSVDWAEERALVTVAEPALRDLGPDPDTPIPLDLEYRVANGLARLEPGSS